MANILIAEDEAASGELIERSLSNAGHGCRSVQSGTAALAALEDGGTELALLSARLPGIDGLAVMRRRPDKSVPVILLTARSNLADRGQAAALGAAGCLVKPIEVLELISCVTAALRRAGRFESRFAQDALTVDLKRRAAICGGENVELTPQEYSLLETLIIYRNLALSREKLAALAWGQTYIGASRSVDVHIQRLRKKLGLEQRIKTIYKLGYRFDTK